VPPAPRAPRRAPARRAAALAVALLLAVPLAACRGSGPADGADGADADRSGRPAGDRKVVAAPAAAAGLSTPQHAGDTLLARADSARIQGSPSATAWIIEISDFQCPYCRQWHQSTYERLRAELVATGRARLAYVNFPLPNHRNARPAAEAAMCAAAQHRFWEMHDRLFDTQPRWANLGDPTPLFDSLAASAGLDAQQYRQCVRDGLMRPLVQSDFDRAVEAGVNSTPTFIIDNRIRLEGAHGIESFRAALDSIARARSAGGG
jgi:protein-disulfide isomerase